MCRTVRVWKLKTSINTSHLLGFWGRKAPGGKINRILHVWKALGGSKCRILRVWKLKTSINTSHLLGFSGWKAPGVKISCILRVWKALGG